MVTISGGRPVVRYELPSACLQFPVWSSLCSDNVWLKSCTKNFSSSGDAGHFVVAFLWSRCAESYRWTVSSLLFSWCSIYESAAVSRVWLREPASYFLWYGWILQTIGPKNFVVFSPFAASLRVCEAPSSLWLAVWRIPVLTEECWRKLHGHFFRLHRHLVAGALSCSVCQFEFEILRYFELVWIDGNENFLHGSRVHFQARTSCLYSPLVWYYCNGSFPSFLSYSSSGRVLEFSNSHLQDGSWCSELQWWAGCCCPSYEVLKGAYFCWWDWCQDGKGTGSGDMK